MGLRDITRQDIEREINRLLSHKDWRSEEMTKHLLKKWHLHRDSDKYKAVRKKLLRTRKAMCRAGKAFFYDVGRERYYSKERPRKTHMNSTAAKFVESLENCKYEEKTDRYGNIKFLAGVYALSDNVGKRDLVRECPKVLKRVKDLYRLQGGLQKVEDPFRVAYIICVTNEK